MNELEIQPMIGVGPVRFGMNRDESREVLASNPQSFRKTAGGGLVDAYFESCLQISFDRNDTVEYIEASSGGSLAMLYRGIDVLSLPSDRAVALISLDAPFDPNAPEFGYAYVFPTLELSLWRPALPEQSDPTDDDRSAGRIFASIGLGRAGYYSNDG